MSFKYQAPENFKATSLEIAGTTYKVEKGVIESDADIAHILARMVLNVRYLKPKQNLKRKLLLQSR